MRRISLFLFFLSYFTVSAQVEISNKNFNFFDLMQIENRQIHSQILVSASLDEIGYSLEQYRFKRNYFSISFSASYKRLLPNLGNIWVPLTTQWQAFFPMNGLMGSMRFKWFFNHRKFTFAGIKLSGGYLWTLHQEMEHSITLHGSNIAFRDQLHFHHHIRGGFDLLAGRKIVNKMISEIWLEAGFRLDDSKMEYQCLNCPTNTSPAIHYSHQLNGMFHFQLWMAFDLFS